MSNWIVLAAAGLLEVVFAVALKLSRGFSQPSMTALAAVAMIASLSLLALAMRAIPLGTAYAVWTGIGAAGTVLAGMLWFGEPASVLRLACVALILAGVAGLKCGG